jgi:excisionase family DNA binding protein
MKDATLEQRLRVLEKAILQQKKIFTFDEACDYTGFSRSYMYKITSQLPFSKPNGKTLFIAKDDLDNWLLSNRSKSSQQRDYEAATYVATH